jgi:hypothetical protein
MRYIYAVWSLVLRIRILLGEYSFRLLPLCQSVGYVYRLASHPLLNYGVNVTERTLEKTFWKRNPLVGDYMEKRNRVKIRILTAEGRACDLGPY